MPVTLPEVITIPPKAMEELRQVLELETLNQSVIMKDEELIELGVFLLVVVATVIELSNYHSDIINH